MIQHQKSNNLIGFISHSVKVANMKNLMRKLSVCLILFSFTALICNAQTNKKTDWERDGLKGKVKNIVESNYAAVDKLGKIAKGDEYPPSFGFSNSVITTYDSAGNVIIGEYYAIQIFSYRYDDYGNRIENNNYSIEDSTLVMKIVYQNDIAGNAIEEHVYSDEYSDVYHVKALRLSTKSTHLYDEHGNTIETNRYDEKDNLVSKTTYEYDKQNRIVKIVVHNAGRGQPYEDIEAYSYSKFDSKGNWVERTTYYGKAREPVIVTERTIEYYE